MKILLITLPLAILVAFMALQRTAGQTPASGPPLSIGYVSAQRVFAESTEGKAELAKLQAFQQEKMGELKTRQATLESTRQRLANAEGAARIELQQQEILQRTDLERSTAQAQLDFQNRQRQVQTDVQVRVKAVLGDLVKAQSIQLVLNGDQAVLWGVPGMDLTAAVIGRLEAKPAK